MEDLAQTATQVIRDLAVYELNGLLVIVYAIVAQWALALAGLCGAGVLVLDRLALLQVTLSARPGVPAPVHSMRLTLGVLALWIIVAITVPQPVPALGLAMWAVTLAVAWLIPPARLQTLWRGKMALLMYALANIGLLLFTRLTANLSPEQWAALLGSTQAANQTIDQGKGIVQTIATIAIWYAIPVGYIGWLVKEFAVNQGSLVAPGRTAADIVHAIRTRGGLAE
jgi:hypothetical protein